MGQLSDNDYKAIFAAIETAYSISSIEQFHEGVSSAVGKIFPHDIISDAELDPLEKKVILITGPPTTTFTTEALKETFNRHMFEHPLVIHYSRTSDRGSHTISEFLSQRQFHNSGLYSEFYRPLDVEYQLGSNISINPQYITGITINRKETDFRENERSSLNLVLPHLVQTYRNAQTLDLMQRGIEVGGRKAITVSRFGRIQLASEESWRLITTFFGISRPPGSLPEMLLGWIRHERSRFHNNTDALLPPEPLVMRKEDKKLTVRFVWEGTAAVQDMLLIKEETVSPRPASSVESGLSPREGDIFTWLSQGKSNAEIADILSISPLTVKKHLQNIYRKLQVHGRTSALARTWQR